MVQGKPVLGRRSCQGCRTREDQGLMAEYPEAGQHSCREGKSHLTLRHRRDRDRSRDTYISIQYLFQIYSTSPTTYYCHEYFPHIIKIHERYDDETVRQKLAATTITPYLKPHITVFTFVHGLHKQDTIR